MPTPPLPTSAEVAVVGAGFAGLSAALTLGRAQRDVLVLGAGPTRNAETLHSHNILTREGASPTDLLRLARADVEAQRTVTFADAHVTTIARTGDDGPLRLETAEGSVITAHAVLLATGVRDALPDVPGLIELWGRRIHSCPFCDAGEYPGGRLAVLADPPAATRIDTLLSGWTDRRTVVAPADVVQVTQDGDHVVLELTDGDPVRVDAVFVGGTPLPRLDAIARLAADRRGPFVAVDGDGRTSVPRLWAAGDCAWADGAGGPGGQVVQAMAAGSVAAISIIVAHAGVPRPAPPERSPAPTAPADPGDDPEPSPATARPEDGDARAFWEDRYASAERVWSGRPSRALVEALDGISAGTALELGCGEGADAIWLAERGWTVTAVDLSATALDRAARTAVKRGVGGRITWVQADLAEGLPDATADGGYDLVLAAHLLSPVDFPRDAVLRQAAEAVATGGLLVILSHLHPPAGSSLAAGHHHVDLPDVDSQLARLDLGDGWTVRRAEPVDARHRAPDGTVATRRDSVIVLRRS